MTATFKTIGSFKLLVASTNVAIPLSSTSIPANRVDIQAISANAGAIIVGDNTITTDIAHGGISLSAGDIYNIELITDLKNIYITGASGDGVIINYWIGDRN